MKLFYSAFIESVSFNIVKNKLEKVVNLCCKISGVTLNNHQHLYEERATSKAQSFVSQQGGGFATLNVALSGTDCPSSHLLMLILTSSDH